jgi:hypothetical protein
MKNKIKITANLTAKDVEEILKDYFLREDYEVTSFSFQLQLKEAHSPSEIGSREFSGVNCQLKKREFA